MQTVALNWTAYRLVLNTGKVLNSLKNLETKVSGSGGGSAIYDRTWTNPIKITSETTIHDQIILGNDNGQEYAYQLSGFNLACREGNKLTVITALKQRNNRGHYFAIINHTTNQTFYHHDVIERLCRPISFLYPAVIVLNVFLCRAIFETGWLFCIIATIASCAALYFFTLSHNKKKLYQAIANLNFN